MFKKLRLRIEPSWHNEPVEEIKLFAKGLVRRTETPRHLDGRRMPSLVVSEAIPSGEQWAVFSTELHRIGVWDWDPLTFSMVMDGWAWLLLLDDGEKHCRINASYTLPDKGWSEFYEAITRLTDQEAS